MKSTKAILAACALSIFAPSVAAQQTQPAPTDSISMAVGVVLGNNIKNTIDHLASIGITIDNAEFLATIANILDGKTTAFTPEQANTFVDNVIRVSIPEELPDSFTKESQKEFINQVSSMPGAVTTPSGLVFITEVEGNGPIPTKDNDVKLKYTGRFYDGSIFDSTGTPIEFKVTHVVAGLSEALQMMKAGGRYRVIIPAHLGYGEDGIPGAIPANAALDFTVELIEVQ